MNISIDHPTDRPNFAIVKVGSTQLAFSYKTLIGVSLDFGRWIVSENVWSATTGKHLNYLTDKANRVPFQEFEDLTSDIEVRITR